MKRFICNSLEDTKAAAEYFAEQSVPGQCFALYGNLGFGKTTFVQYFIKSLNPEISAVNSPTFNIVQIYPAPKCEIIHIDCYRLRSEEEFFEIGIEELFSSSITLIEWPEIIENILPANTTKLKFSKDNDTRIIEQI